MGMTQWKSWRGGELNMNKIEFVHQKSLETKLLRLSIVSGT